MFDVAQHGRRRAARGAAARRPYPGAGQYRLRPRPAAWAARSRARSRGSFNIYPQGNFIEAMPDTILFPGRREQVRQTGARSRADHRRRPYREAAKCVLISFDSTHPLATSRSACPSTCCGIRGIRCASASHRRIGEGDPYFTMLRQSWGGGLRQRVRGDCPIPTGWPRPSARAWRGQRAVIARGARSMPAPDAHGRSLAHPRLGMASRYGCAARDDTRQRAHDHPRRPASPHDRYAFDRPVALSPHEIRLRPAAH